jgi:hypothetical protein
MAWVMLLVAALMALMLSSPHGKQHFAAGWPDGLPAA